MLRRAAVIVGASLALAPAASADVGDIYQTELPGGCLAPTGTPSCSPFDHVDLHSGDLVVSPACCAATRGPASSATRPA